MASFVAKMAYDNKVPEVLRPFDTSFEEIVALMYPGECGHCESRPCHCRPLDVEGKPDKKMRIQTLKTKREHFRMMMNYPNWRLDLWVCLFEDIYAAPTNLLPVEIIGFHLAEEVGEVAKAIRNGQHVEGKESSILKIEGTGRDKAIAGLRSEIEDRRYELEVEIAQSFSWLCSLFLRIRHMFQGLKEPSDKVVDLEISVPRPIDGDAKRPLRLCDLLIKRFGADNGMRFICDNCGKSPCKCELYLVEYAPHL